MKKFSGSLPLAITLPCHTTLTFTLRLRDSSAILATLNFLIDIDIDIALTLVKRRRLATCDE